MSNLQENMDQMDKITNSLSEDKQGRTQKLLESLVRLVEYKEALKAQLKDNEVQLESVLKALGLNYSFQAPDGIVYKITKPTGTFISFKEIDYARTKKVGEAKGSLSKTEAKELGYTVD
jgi:hypothetical protein